MTAIKTKYSPSELMMFFLEPFNETWTELEVQQLGKIAHYAEDLGYPANESLENMFKVLEALERCSAISTRVNDNGNLEVKLNGSWKTQ